MTPPCGPANVAPASTLPTKRPLFTTAREIYRLQQMEADIFGPNPAPLLDFERPALAPHPPKPDPSPIPSPRFIFNDDMKPSKRDSSHVVGNSVSLNLVLPRGPTPPPYADRPHPPSPTLNLRTRKVPKTVSGSPSALQSPAKKRTAWKKAEEKEALLKSGTTSPALRGKTTLRARSVDNLRRTSGPAQK